MTSVKMDPATIGLLISIAPTVLDLLFGQGHIKDSLRQQRYPLENMYGYGLEGYGYRYPRRRRKLTVETYYPESLQPELIRAAVFNRAIAKKNDWIQLCMIQVFTTMFENYYGKQRQPTNQKIQ
jgi:hypothetical protein